MEEEVRVDKDELFNQMREDLMSDGYAKAELIIGMIPKQPMCDLSIHHVTYKEIGLLYNSLEEVKKVIKEKYPLATLWAEECLEMGNSKKIEEEGSNNE